MKLFESIGIAFRALSANKLRSILTMLGIIIGVGAVIALMSVGRGAQSRITSTFEQLGTNVLNIVPASPEVSGMMGVSPLFSTPSLTLDDARALENIASTEGVAAVTENFTQITFGGESKTSMIHGSTPAYLHLQNYAIASGEFIAERHVTSRDMVVVLGNEVAEYLFGSSDPIGERVSIKGLRFTVIGILEPKGGAIMGFSLDNLIVVPVTTYQTRLFTLRTPNGEDAVQSISVKAANAEVIDDIRYEIDVILRKRHRIASDEEKDFAIVSQEQIAGIMAQITGVFTIFLGSIAGISLLVGSIGIMNIMLVSVTERTREIGIRKAVGAKRRDILVQFLLEASILSLLGGGIGIAGGWALSYLVSQIDLGGTSIPSLVSLDIVALAVTVSLIIGLASGLYPAIRAARLNPIEALRYG